jgi:hypothetical protein
MFDDYFAPSTSPFPTAGGVDPFGIDNTCINPTGHVEISSCGDVVCVHCGRIAWR